MPPMQKVVDVPGIPVEYAIPSLVPVLKVTEGMRSPHVITRIIEKAMKMPWRGCARPSAPTPWSGRKC